MKNYWIIAIGTSFLFHSTLILIYVPSVFRHDSSINVLKIKKEIEITPQEIKRIAKEKGTIEKNAPQKNSTHEQFTAPPYIGNVADKLIVNSNLWGLDKPQIIENNAKEIFISDMNDSELIKATPSYMNYYNSITAKLSKIAHRNYKITKNSESGEVSVSFSIFKDGKLQYAKVSGNNAVLKELTLKIIKEASPFKPFPEELRGSSCPFSIVIDFKNN